MSIFSAELIQTETGHCLVIISIEAYESDSVQTHQVAYEAQVGYGEQSSQDIKQHVV